MALAIPGDHSAGSEAVDPKGTTAEFSGATFDHALDHPRLSGQLAGVMRALEGGGWWTLAELAAAAGGSEAGCSARLRDLRKRRCGRHVVERRRRGDPRCGLWEYSLGDREYGPGRG